MKKKIALFLVAMLLGVGLIVSCGGGGDDDDDGNGPGTNPGQNKPAGTQYTVSFDTAGGTPAKIESIKVDAGKSAGASKWPDNPTKDECEFDGWFDAANAEYTASTTITKDVAVTAKWSLRPAKDLGVFTVFGGQASQKGWASIGVEIGADIEWEEITSAKYIVLHTKGGDSTTEFLTSKVIVQGNGNGWAWNSTSISTIDGVTFARADDKDVFIVIEFNKLTGYESFISGTSGKFILEYAGGSMINLGLGLQAGYLSYQTLAKPAGAAELKIGEDVVGFVTETNILGLELPTTYYTVSFDTNGGTPAVAQIKVGSGKSMGVQYPTWVKIDGYEFLGWFGGNAATITVAQQKEDGFDQDSIVATWGTKYDPSTKVTENVTLKAGWIEQDWPVIKKTTKATVNSTGKEWDVNGSTPFKYFIVASKGTSGDGFGGIQFGLQGRITDDDSTKLGQLVRSTGDWTGLSHTAGEIVYFIIDLTQYTKWDDLNKADISWAQFRVNHGEAALGNFQGYIVDNSVQSLTKPDGAGDFGGGPNNKPGSPDDDGFLTGYVTKTLPAELK